MSDMAHLPGVTCCMEKRGGLKGDVLRWEVVYSAVKAIV